jgi:hypothetical protein
VKSKGIRYGAAHNSGLSDLAGELIKALRSMEINRRGGARAESRPKGPAPHPTDGVVDIFAAVGLDKVLS